MLMEFRAGGLVAPVSGVSAPPPQPSPARAGEGEEAEAGEGEDARLAGSDEVAGACAAGRIPLAGRWIGGTVQAAGRLFAGLTGIGGNADRRADAAALCGLGGEEETTAASAEERRGAELASAARPNGARCTVQAEVTPHLPASGPIFAGKNGSPSRAPCRSASWPNPSRGEGTRADGTGTSDRGADSAALCGPGGGRRVTPPPKAPPNNCRIVYVELPGLAHWDSGAAR